MNNGKQIFRKALNRFTNDPAYHHNWGAAKIASCLTSRGSTMPSSDFSDLSTRLYSKVAHDPNSGCWLWTGYSNKKGYGKIGVGKNTGYAHRVSWELSKGEIPDSKYVLHKCDTPSCINPDHLFLGSQKDNMDDMVKKGRSIKRTHCKYGHEFDSDNTNKTKGDRCLTCKRARGRKYSRKKRLMLKQALS